MLFGAYYYGWYRNLWLCKTVRKDDPPLLGEYDNMDASKGVFEEHAKMMSSAGIDFAAISYQGEDHGHLIDVANQVGLKVTYFYESLWRGVEGLVPKSSLPLIVEDMRKISDFMMEPSWLRIDGRPVLMLYVTRCFREAPNEMIGAIRDACPDVFLVGDELFWDDVPDERIRMFDAVTSYNLYQPGRFIETVEDAGRTYLDACRERMGTHADQARRLGVPLWGNAMPGYDDSGVRPDKNHFPLPRDDGKYYSQSLLDASAMPGDCIMISSWNEFYEDSAIESVSSYGSKYLDMTKKFKEDMYLEGLEG